MTRSVLPAPIEDLVEVGQCAGVAVLTFLVCLLFYAAFERNTAAVRRLLRRRFADC